MEQLSNESYRDMINNLTSDKKIQYIFNRVPFASIQTYRKTLGYKANLEYSKSSELLPNTFFKCIEDYLKEFGVLKTYKKYEKEFQKLQDFFGVDTKEITTSLRGLLSDNSQIRYKSVNMFKELIRNYNSQYKGQFIKKYTQDKLNELKSKSEKINKTSYNMSDIKINYSFRDFFKEFYKDPMFINEFNALLEEASNVYVEEIYWDVIEAINSGKSLEDILHLFGIFEPFGYDKNYLVNQKSLNRLNTNFTKIFNKNSEEYRVLLVEYINSLLDGKKDNTLAKEIKVSDKNNIDICYKELRIMKGRASLDSNNNIYFEADLNVNQNKNIKYKEYKEKLAAVKKFLKYSYMNYKEAKQKLIESAYASTEISQGTEPVFNDDNYIIPANVYINDETINKLRNFIYGINTNKLYNLTPYELDALNDWLNNKGLLFCYLIGNISSQDLLTIINNFSNLLSYAKQANIEMENYEDVLRIATIFRFVSDIDIALIGYDNLVKIINYNQFAGTTVDDNTIKERIKKAKYLMTESELKNKSSLPYDIKVKKDGLILYRYYNNNPDVLISGIETKTCFFISVNENDFFFYSLLNKNGYVIKIVDEQGNFIARASCFRRNNALMINGIRLKNNEIIANNKEQKDLMNQVVSLIETMSEKIIYETSKDECPIDYVLCNKAGILENSEFDTRYEMIDFKLIREPIDVYNDDWKEFVNIANKQDGLLQEVKDFPDRSFTTDFGDNYPLVLIKSRNNMGLVKPSDISLNTQKATYKRPKFSTKIYTTDEIDDYILKRINRIRALYTCMKKNKKGEKEFKLIKNPSDIATVVVADDWIGINYKDGKKEYAYTNYENINYEEFRRYSSSESFINKVQSREYILKRN